MDRRYDLRTLTDRRGNALDRLCPHIADRKYPATRRFQRMPAGAGVFAGANKTLRVLSYARSVQPVGVGVGADKKEQVSHRPPHFLTVCARAPADGFKDAVTPFKTADGDAGQNLHIAET